MQTPPTSEAATAADGDDDMPLLAHIEALRWTILRSLLVVAVLFLPAVFAAPPLIRHIIRTCVPPAMGKLHYFSPMEAFMAQLKMGLVLAFLAGAPFIAREIWRFVAPALYPRERRFTKGLFLVSSLLFVGGAAFACLLILPLVMRFSYSFSSEQLQPVIGLGAFLGLCGGLLLAFGIMFQTPLLLIFLVATGVVRLETLQRTRRYAVIAILVLSALLTPPDVTSQMMLALPTWLLFEAGLLVARAFAPKPDPT